MDTLSEEILSGFQKSTGHDDDGGSTISSFDILSFGDLDEHLSGWMDDGHHLEDGGTIICNENFTTLVLDLNI